jgi:hypothetical protein
MSAINVHFYIVANESVATLPHAPEVRGASILARWQIKRSVLFKVLLHPLVASKEGLIALANRGDMFYSQLSEANVW